MADEVDLRRSLSEKSGGGGPLDRALGECSLFAPLLLLPLLSATTLSLLSSQMRFESLSSPASPSCFMVLVDGGGGAIWSSM